MTDAQFKLLLEAINGVRFHLNVPSAAPPDVHVANHIPVPEVKIVLPVHGAWLAILCGVVAADLFARIAELVFNVTQ